MKISKRQLQRLIKETLNETPTITKWSRPLSSHQPTYEARNDIKVGDEVRIHRTKDSQIGRFYDFLHGTVIEIGKKAPHLDYNSYKVRVESHGYDHDWKTVSPYTKWVSENGALIADLPPQDSVQLWKRDGKYYHK